MKLREDIKPVYWQLYDGEVPTATTELKELLQKLYDEQDPQWHNEFRILIFIDVGLPGAPPITGVSPQAACFDVLLGNIPDILGDIEQACKRVGEIKNGQLRIGYGRFGAAGEYTDIKNRTIYGERMIYGSVPEVLLAKNVIRRAGRFGKVWNWFVKRYDREDWPMN